MCPFIEVGALHEAFGDCTAILNALEDEADRGRRSSRPRPTCPRTSSSRAWPNSSATRSAREYGADSVESGALRHALNTFRWVEPTNLPSWAPADELAGEVHSFARVFVGAFYDTIRNIYDCGPKRPLNLRKASRTAGKLLVAAVRTVPAAPDTFSGVGQRMIQADVTTNKGVNAKAISDAFDAHGMTLAAPVTSLPVPLGPRTRRGATGELRERLGVPQGTKVEVNEVESDSHGTIGHVTAYRAVPLDARGAAGRQHHGARCRTGPDDPARRSHRGRPRRRLAGQRRRRTPGPGIRPHAHRQRRHPGLGPGHARRGGSPPPPAVAPPKRTASHEIRIVAGEPTIVRVGFSLR